MANTITYAIDPEGVVVSRVGSLIAWPVLDFEHIGAGGASKDINTGKEYGSFVPRDFNGPMRYDLQKFSVFDIAPEEYGRLRWTKKISLEVKNYHRAFWGMKALKK